MELEGNHKVIKLSKVWMEVLIKYLFLVLFFLCMSHFMGSLNPVMI
jgi:hypothetical protein